MDVAYDRFQQIQIRVHWFEDYQNDRYRGIIVSQTVSVARTEYQPLPSVPFSYDGQLGFPLRLAMDQQFAALEHALDTPQLNPAGMRVALRIHVSYTSLRFLLVN